MAGLYRNSIEAILYDSPPPVEKPKHVTEAKEVCSKNISKIVERIERKNSPKAFEDSILDQTEDNVMETENQEYGTDCIDGAADLYNTKNESNQNYKSPGGFSFANSSHYNTVIQNIIEITPEKVTNELSDDKENSLVETPILRCLNRQNSGYDVFQSRCLSDTGRTSTPTTPRRVFGKCLSGKRLFENATAKQSPEVTTVTKTTHQSPPRNEFKPLVETPVLRTAQPRQSFGYQLYKNVCDEENRVAAATTAQLFQFLDNETSGIETPVVPKQDLKLQQFVSVSKPSTPCVKQQTTPMRPKSVSAKVVHKPRPKSTYSNSSEGSTSSNGTDCSNKYSSSARKEVLAASAKFSQWEPEQLNYCAVGSAKLRLNVLQVTQKTIRTAEMQAVIETYSMCVKSPNPALEALCLALVDLNNNVADQELTEHEKYAAYKYTQRVQV